MPKMLRHEKTGDLYIYTAALATREDMVEVEDEPTPEPTPAPKPKAKAKPKAEPKPIVEEESEVKSEDDLDSLFGEE
jgi:hypothetical protein